jgi:integrase
MTKTVPYFRVRRLANRVCAFYFIIPKHVWRPEMPLLRSTALGRDEYKAQAKALELYEKLREWRKTGEAKDHKTISYIWDVYTKDEAYTSKSDETKHDYNYAYRQTREIKNNGVFLCDVPLDLFDSFTAKELYAQVLKKYGMLNARKIMSVIRLLFNFGKNGVRPQIFSYENPFEKLRMKTPRPKNENYPYEHVQAIIQAAREATDEVGDLALAVDLNYYISQRPGDLCALRRGMVESALIDGEEHCFFRFVQHKMKRFQEEAVVPFPRRFLPEIMKKEDYIILNKHGRPFTRDSLQKVFRTICERLGFMHYHMHTIRNSGANAYLEAGVNSSAVAPIGGWRDTTMLERVYKSPTKRLTSQALKKRLEMERRISTLHPKSLNPKGAN